MIYDMVLKLYYEVTNHIVSDIWDNVYEDILLVIFFDMQYDSIHEAPDWCPRTRRAVPVGKTPPHSSWVLCMPRPLTGLSLWVRCVLFMRTYIETETTGNQHVRTRSKLTMRETRFDQRSVYIYIYLITIRRYISRGVYDKGR